MRKISFILSTLFLLPVTGGMEGSNMFAQRQQTSSSFLTAGPKGAQAVSFRTNGKLSEYITPAEPVKWGMDVAWNWDVNVVRGTNAITKDVLKIGRVSFQPAIMKDDNNLSDWQIKNLQDRLNNIAKSGVKDIVLNCDHEVLMNKDTYPDCEQNYAAYCGNPQQWYKVIKATAQYCQYMGYNVVAVSPFNESDYGWSQYKYRGGTPTTTEQNTTGIANFKEIARLISEDSYFNGVRISGGNTLNCDRALAWYNGLKPYVTEGNTHQLAGSMSTYTNFWKTVRNDGNVATADELHNTMEAFIGIHYGMQQGIWWGWDGIARGEFCQASHYGKEIGYAENSSNWTAATVYKWNRKTTDTDASDEERINAFAGASERQAKPTTFDFISTDRPAYFDGYGPVYSYSQFIPADPNGTYASDKQRNAERTIGITYGEDVPTDYPRTGNFIIMNAKSKCALNNQNSPIKQMKYASSIGPTEYYVWTIEPVKEDIGGDFSYCTIKKYNSTDGKNLTTNSEWGTESGILAKYSGNWANGGRNEWFFEYAGENFWYIRNRWTGFYLQPKSGSTSTSASIEMVAYSGKPEQKWRFIPALVPITTTTKKQNGMLELDAPAMPTGLKATKLTGSVSLSWNKNGDADLAGYNVLRSKAATMGEEAFDVIGRVITDTTFIDNDVKPGETYIYKVKAVDRTRNQSSASDAVEVVNAKGRNLVARYPFDSNVNDTTENILDARTSGTVTFKTPSAGAKQGKSCLYLDGTSTIAQLPATLGDMDEMTISMWVNGTNTTTTWTRLFDFGNDTDHYFFLTPTNGSEMRLVFKNGGEEQILSTSRLSIGWHFIAATIGKDKVTLYVDDKAVSSTSITIRPSDIKPRRNYIGTSQFAADPLFRGYIDDLHIYDYELSAKEVETLRNGRELPTGDANRDGKVTVADANMVINYSLGDTSIDIDTDAADMDLDGKVTAEDANMIVNQVIGE